MTFILSDEKVPFVQLLSLTKIISLYWPFFRYPQQSAFIFIYFGFVIVKEINNIRNQVGLDWSHQLPFAIIF